MRFAERFRQHIGKVALVTLLGMTVFGCGGETGGFASGIGGSLVDGAERHTSIYLAWNGTATTLDLPPNIANIDVPVGAHSAIVRLLGGGFEGSDIEFAPINDTKNLQELKVGTDRQWPKLFNLGTDRTLIVEFHADTVGAGPLLGIATYKASFKKAPKTFTLDSTDFVINNGPIITQQGRPLLVKVQVSNLPTIFAKSAVIRAFEDGTNTEFNQTVTLSPANFANGVLNGPPVLVVDRNVNFTFHVEVYAGTKGQGARLNQDDQTSSVVAANFTSSPLSLTSHFDSGTHLLALPDNVSLGVGNTFTAGVFLQDAQNNITSVANSVLSFTTTQTGNVISGPGGGTTPDGIFTGVEFGHADIGVAPVADGDYAFASTSIGVDVINSAISGLNVRDLTSRKFRLNLSTNPNGDIRQMNLFLAPADPTNPQIDIPLPYQSTGARTVTFTDDIGAPGNNQLAITGPGTVLSAGQFKGQKATGGGVPEPHLLVTYTGPEGTFTAHVTIQVVGGTGVGVIH